MKRTIAVILQLLGIASMSVAGFCVAMALGWLVLGLGSCVVGVAFERETRKGPNPGADDAAREGAG